MTEVKYWTVYLLRCRDNNLYCGITNHLDRRIRQHNG
ncbi:MAG: GIY-YIG nuclease family protein, partial [Candidatus Thioglobus sp.]|nr:GIY-YIG nuclease family protein [Candidatus Thioglobus sp.]